MLKSIPQDSPYYTRSRRLVKFLNYFKDCGDESEIRADLHSARIYRRMHVLR